MPKNILIFAYYSYKDPIFQSAVLPYFTEIEYPGVHFYLLTFEHEKYQYNNGEIESIEASLNRKSMTWYRLRWRSGSFKLVKKVVDLYSSLAFSIKLIKRNKIDAVYSEGFPGAILSHIISKFANLPHIVHTFEPHGEYMLEAGIWKENSWEFKLQKSFETRVAKGAFAILTATQAMGELIQKWHTKAKILRVPSCVDTNLFKPSEEVRAQVRKKLKIENQELLFVYLGKFGGMYMDDQFFALLRKLQDYGEFVSKFLILSKDDHAVIEKQIKKHGIARDLVTIMALSREEVPNYLNAADFGVVAVNPYPSKRYCSPIKDGEYWACGLPIIIPEGVSDDFLFTEKYNLGIVWREGDDIPHKVHDFCVQSDLKEIRKKCAAFAVEDRSIMSYQPIYQSLFKEV